MWGAVEFKASTYYAFYFKEVQVHEAFRWLWKSKCIPKIKVFGWLLLSDRLNTRNMLKRRHYNVGDDLDCLLCEAQVEETVEHLFFHCAFSKECWQILGISWTTHDHRLQLLNQAREIWRKPMFMDVFLVAAWSLWKERNNNYFRGISPAVPSWRQRFIKYFSDLTYRTSEIKRQFITAFLDAIPQQTHPYYLLLLSPHPKWCWTNFVTM